MPSKSRWKAGHSQPVDDEAEAAESRSASSSQYLSDADEEGNKSGNAPALACLLGRPFLLTFLTALLRQTARMHSSDRLRAHRFCYLTTRFRVRFRVRLRVKFGHFKCPALQTTPKVDRLYSWLPWMNMRFSLASSRSTWQL